MPIDLRQRRPHVLRRRALTKHVPHGPQRVGRIDVVRPIRHEVDTRGFGGQFGASSTQSAWGSITLSFPDCASMHFTYAARAGLTPPVPGGSGERMWTRLTGANGLACN